MEKNPESNNQEKDTKKWESYDYVNENGERVSVNYAHPDAGMEWLTETTIVNEKKGYTKHVLKYPDGTEKVETWPYIGDYKKQDNISNHTSHNTPKESPNPEEPTPLQLFQIGHLAQGNPGTTILLSNILKLYGPEVFDKVTTAPIGTGGKIFQRFAECGDDYERFLREIGIEI